jgi:2-methylcitrate dehydratase PrpD
MAVTTTNPVLPLAEFAAHTQFADLPPEVVDYTKLLAMKCAANMIAGSTMPGSEGLLKVIRRRADAAEASVFGSDVKASLWGAILANSFYAHAAELEDDAFKGEGGASWTITTVPVVFALAEHFGIPGKDLLEALAVGLETHRRTAQFQTFHRGVMLGPGAPGPAAAAGKIFGLTADEMRAAMGLATSGPFVAAINYGTDAHFFESALQSLQAVIAAEAAKEGLTGNPDIARYMSGLFGEVDGDKISESLGERWMLLDFWIKKYPSSFGVHRAVDVALELQRTHGITYDDVDWVEVYEETQGHPKVPTDWPEPKDVQEAQVSMQYCVGVAILHGDLNLDHVTQTAVDDPDNKAACAKVRFLPTLIENWKPLSTPQRVVIVTTDGRRFEDERLYPIGSPEDPLPPERVADLYRKYTRGILPDAQIEETIESFMNLEQLDSAGVRRLLGLLREGSRPAQPAPVGL